MSESERDVVAIRGLDPNLYNQILMKAREMGQNVSELVNEALRMYLDKILAIPVPTVLGEGLADLRIRKSDLEKLGKVIIRGAADITFEEDIDDKAIEEYIVAIEDCADITVPQRAYLSLIKKAKDCSDIRSYTESSSPISQREGEDVVRIGDLEELELSKEDLESFGKKLVLQGIEHLKLSQDVDAETVDKYIDAILDVNDLEVPRRIYMLILTKQKGCETITKY